MVLMSNSPKKSRLSIDNFWNVLTWIAMPLGVFVSAEYGSICGLIASFTLVPYILAKCNKCCKDTQVSAIILPEGFEAVDEQAIDDLEAREDSVEITPFCSQDYLSLVSYITYISPEALDEIDKFTNYIFFQKSYSSATGYSYYRSLCQHCNSAQGDNYIISEYNSAFFPIDVDKFTKIKFYKINKYIEVCAGSNSIGYSSDNQFRRSNIYNNSKL